LIDDSQTHNVRVVLGEKAKAIQTSKLAKLLTSNEQVVKPLGLRAQHPACRFTLKA